MTDIDIELDRDLDVLRRRLIERMTFGDPDQCWPWLGAPDAQGYGRISIEGRQISAHRAVYRVFVGPIPPGHDVGHGCHDADPDCPGGVCAHRICCNWFHLAAQTRAENARAGKCGASARARLKGKRFPTCRRGHAMTPQNAYERPDGRRYCRQCRSDREKAAR